MDDLKRRTAGSLAVLALLMLLYAVAYYYGMRAFEGEPITFLHALQIVVETFTTTGFGSDSPWTSPEMNVLVIVMDLTGVALIFLALPVFVFPVLETALSTTVPAEAPEIEDHVVLGRASARTEPLVEELAGWGVEAVVVEPDRDAALALQEQGYTVVQADPQTANGLEAARLPDARAIVADASDTVNTSIVLTAAELAPDTHLVSVVEDPDRAPYHRIAGADDVLTPRRVLGESLATTIATGATMGADDAVEIGDLEVAEVPVDHGSQLAGRRVRDCNLRERTGVNVIGAWFQGEFASPPTPDARVDGGTVFLVTGTDDQLDRLREIVGSTPRRVGRGRTIVAGHGEVGSAAVSTLASADVPYTVLDREDGPEVDVVGDATDPDDLREAGIDAADTLLIALPDDAETEFATLVARDLAPEIRIVARAQETESVRKGYRAGADYVLALATITGRMIAATILGEDVITLDTQMEVVRTPAAGLAGQTLGEAHVRRRTGVTVVGVERDGEMHTELGPDFRIGADDQLVIVGTDEGTRAFREEFGG
jgi:Trk K+ transport system NAD-binding subunit